MRSFTAAVVIAALVIFFSVFYTEKIESTSELLVSENTKISRLLQDENYSEALILTKNMAEYVDRKKLSLAIIMDHSELDKIELSICELAGYIEGEVKTDSLAKCSMLGIMLRHMPKNYKLKIENIL